MQRIKLGLATGCVLQLQNYRFSSFQFTIKHFTFWARISKTAINQMKPVDGPAPIA